MTPLSCPEVPRLAASTASTTSINVTLQPSFTVRQNAVSPTDAATYNPAHPLVITMMADHRAGIDPIRFPIPKGQYDIPQFIPQYI